MPEYDRLHFVPPAPVAAVVLRNPANEATTAEATLLTDTGADVSLLPRSEIEQPGIRPLPDRLYELAGFDGSKSLAQVVMLDVLFLRRAFRGQYLLTDEERGVLGRDVLNNLSLVLDGPQQRWSERSP